MVPLHIVVHNVIRPEWNACRKGESPCPGREKVSPVLNPSAHRHYTWCVKTHVGTSGYSYKEWKGKFYPDRIPPKEMLSFYSRRFDTVEINNTFYRMPKEDLLLGWARQVPDGFIFALKASQVITHIKRLRNIEAEATHLMETVAVLGEEAGARSLPTPRQFREGPHTAERAARSPSPGHDRFRVQAPVLVHR